METDRSRDGLGRPLAALVACVVFLICSLGLAASCTYIRIEDEAGLKSKAPAGGDEAAATGIYSRAWKDESESFVDYLFIGQWTEHGRRTVVEIRYAGRGDIVRFGSYEALRIPGCRSVYALRSAGDESARKNRWWLWKFEPSEEGARVSGFQPGHSHRKSFDAAFGAENRIMNAADEIEGYAVRDWKAVKLDSLKALWEEKPMAYVRHVAPEAGSKTPQYGLEGDRD